MYGDTVGEIKLVRSPIIRRKSRASPTRRSNGRTAITPSGSNAQHEWQAPRVESSPFLFGFIVDRTGVPAWGRAAVALIFSVAVLMTLLSRRATDAPTSVHLSRTAEADSTLTRQRPHRGRRSARTPLPA